LVPRVRQSGATVARYRISKMGNTMTRRHLATAAMALFRTTAETRLKTWGLKICERRGKGRAKMAVARKIAVVMLAMWKRGTAFEPFVKAVQPNHHAAHLVT